MHPRTDDENAIRKVLAGDTEAFRPLLERYRKPVLSFIYNMIGQRETAEDLGQEVFLKAFRSLDGFEAARGAAFSTWLFAIARNACLDFRRSRARRSAHAEEALPEELAAPSADGLDPETRRSLERALSALPEDQRLAVEWVLVQGFSYEEAARLEGVSVGTLSSRLARAKEKLHRILGQEAGGGHGR